MKKKVIVSCALVAVLCAEIAGSNVLNVGASEVTDSSKAITAYEKILEKDAYEEGSFRLKDIDGDGVKELFACKSFYGADDSKKCTMYDPIIYTYKSGKVKKVKDFTGSPQAFFYNSTKKTLSADWCSCGGVNVEVYKLKKTSMKKVGYLYSAPIEGTGHCNADSDYAYEYESYVSDKIIKLNEKSFNRYYKVYEKSQIATVKNTEENRTKYLK